MAAFASRPTGNSVVFTAQASESVPTDSCRKKGGLWEDRPPIALILIASSAFRNTNPACWASLKSTALQQLSEEAI